MLVGIMLGACSSDDDTMTEEDGGRSMRQLTIADASMGTRATIDPLSLNAAWELSDRPTYVNLSAQLSGELYYGMLTPTVAGTSTTLAGSVYCRQGDDIAVIFPTVTPVMSAGKDAYFTIDLSGQKGTLSDIGARYHYVYGVASGVTVSGDKATGTISEMKSLLSLCKFTFTHSGSPVSVKSVQIGWGTNGATGYPQTGTVTLNQNPTEVHAEGDTPTGSLTVTLDEAFPTGVIYVALFPCDSKLTFHFSVSDGTHTYTGTKSAKMLEGRFYEVEIAVE